MALMVVLTPLGLLAPGGAFGESAPQDLNLGQLGLSAVPAGLAKYSGFWSHTLLGGYGFAGGQRSNLAYLLSALVGIVVVGAAIFAVASLVRLLTGRRTSRTEDRDEVHV
jgi:cobalt/nickel transport system permease protein